MGSPTRAYARIGQAGAVFGFLAVLVGAFGTHALASRVSSDRLATFETGARYQLAHALALLAVAGLGSVRASRALARAGAAFGAGIVIFSGSLYALVLLDQPWLGAVTPLGGLSFLAGWILLVAHFGQKGSPQV